ncbi:MAG: TolC family protein [Bacteroides sp.]|nr:TolC family protein [Bacteroides sp.]
MKKYILFSFLIVAATLLSSLHAQEGWTLRQCIEYAIEHNIQIRRAENFAEQERVSLNTAKWSRLPNLNASASQGWSWGRTTSPVDNTYTNTSSGSSNGSINTNIPVFSGFELPNQKALAELNLKAALADLEKAKEDLSINVAHAYLRVLFTQEIYTIREEQILVSQEQYSRMQQLAEVGKASPAEVAEAEARVAQDEVSMVEAHNNYQLALLDLSQLLELPTPEGLRLAAPDTDVSVMLTPPEEIYTEALMIKPDIKAAIFRLEGSEKSIRIAQNGFYPQLSFGASLSTGFYTVDGKAYENFGDQINNNFNKQIGFSLSIPLFNRFATRNRVRTARLQQVDLALQLDNTKKILYKEIQQAWYNAVAAESTYKTSEVAVAANEEAFRLMGEKFENGKATSLEYNESKLNLTQALSERVQAKYDFLFATKILAFYKGEPIE